MNHETVKEAQKKIKGRLHRDDIVMRGRCNLARKNCGGMLILRQICLVLVMKCNHGGCPS